MPAPHVTGRSIWEPPVIVEAEVGHRTLANTATGGDSDGLDSGGGGLS